MGPNYDLLIKGGRLLDPSQGVDGDMDIGIKAGKVAAIGPVIDATEAQQTMDATGSIVTPGWIDLHVHVYWGVSHYGLEPDTICLNRGVTTAIDVGSAGAWTFPGFRHLIVDRAKTRLYAFLNVSSTGMISPAIGENEEIRLLDTAKAAEVIEANRDILLGVKVRISHGTVGQNGLEPLHRARRVATEVGLPLMVHAGNPDGTLREILALMEPGDIYTHCFHGAAEGLLGEDGRIRPEVREAAARGVRFDVGHGRSNFSWPVVESVMAQGMQPFSISSDLHTYSVHGAVGDQATTLNKFLYLGMSLPEVIRLTTCNPAQEIGMAGTLGTLKVGAPEHVTVADLVSGPVDLRDSKGVIRVGQQRLVPRAAVAAGIVYRAGEVPPCLLVDRPQLSS